MSLMYNNLSTDIGKPYFWFLGCFNSFSISKVLPFESNAAGFLGNWRIAASCSHSKNEPM